MNNRIKYISEAFSMQPRYVYVDSYWDEKSKIKVEKIIPALITVNGDPYEYYEGYDQNEKLLFQYKKETVNVGYF